MSDDGILRNVKDLHGSSGLIETSRGTVEASVVGSGIRIRTRPSSEEEYTVIVPFSMAAETIRKWREEEEIRILRELRERDFLTDPDGKGAR